MSEYIESVQNVSAGNIGYSMIEQFAAGLEGEVIRYNYNRSRVDIHNAAENFTYQCRCVSAKCPACNRRFYDITFTDNTESATGCGHCDALLEY